MLALIAVVVVVAVVHTTPHTPRERAIVTMGAGLMFIWCGLGGAAQWWWRARVVAAIGRLPGSPSLRFVTAATLFAFVEEAVATAMTNAAPLFGVISAEAFITPSANWLHTVTLHSVVVFVPMFMVWAGLLKRRCFHPAEVMLLVGTNGLLAEWLTFGQINPIWWFVYGLMVWLPAQACAHALGAGRPRPGLGTVLIALVLPLVAAAPVAGVMMALHPTGLADLTAP